MKKWLDILGHCLGRRDHSQAPQLFDHSGHRHRRRRRDYPDVHRPGYYRQILSNIQSIGANLITIRPGSSTCWWRQGCHRRRPNTDHGRCRGNSSSRCPTSSAVSPSYSSNLQLVVGGYNTNSQVTGVNPEYFAGQQPESRQRRFLLGQITSTAPR